MGNEHSALSANQKSRSITVVRDGLEALEAITQVFAERLANYSTTAAILNNDEGGRVSILTKGGEIYFHKHSDPSNKMLTVVDRRNNPLDGRDYLERLKDTISAEMNLNNTHDLRRLEIIYGPSEQEIREALNVIKVEAGIARRAGR